MQHGKSCTVLARKGTVLALNITSRYLHGTLAQLHGTARHCTVVPRLFPFALKYRQVTVAAPLHL
jgi:hypothetical protein